jgi:hypothetical protein
MRKARKNLNNKEIERVFLRHPSPSGIIAVYMYRKSEKNIVNVMKMNEKSSIGEGGQSTIGGDRDAS